MQCIRFLGPALLAVMAASLLVPGPAWAADGNSQVEIGGSYDQLSNGFGEWSSIDADLVHEFGRHKKLTGGARRTTRFGLSDSEARVGGYYPLTDSLVGRAEVRVASPADVLPEQTYSLGGQQVIGAGWVVHGGFRHQVYETVDVQTLTVRGEYYFSLYRADLTLAQGRLETGDTAEGFGGSFSRYYGDRGSLTFVFSAGEEIEKISEERVARFETVSLAVWGRHWYSKRWGSTYGIRYREQGDLYEMIGVHAGLRRVF